jgi:hypothetical protein
MRHRFPWIAAFPTSLGGPDPWRYAMCDAEHTIQGVIVS